MSDSSTLVHECSCGARLKVPHRAAGRSVRCPKCGDVTVVARRPVAPDAEQRGPFNSLVEAPKPDSIRVQCSCGAMLKLPASAEPGKRVKCPRCGEALIVPGIEPVATPIMEHAPAESWILDFAKDEETAPAEKTAHPEPPIADGPVCPSCQRRFVKGTRICVECGIDIKTGRAILTTQEDNLDEIYIAAENTIRVISWVLPVSFGYPIASEAFGTAKPWVVRGLALLTVACSVAFWGVTCNDPASKANGLMLWSGNPDIDAYIRQEYAREGLEAPTADELLAIRGEMGVDDVYIGSFEPQQLVTHQFLHADLLHLAGNLLFLMVLGSRVNALLGNIFTLPIYLLLGFCAAWAQMADVKEELVHPMLGASGAIMGMAGMYLVFFPAHKVHMAAWWRWGIFQGFHLSYKIYTLRGFWVVLMYIAFDVVAELLGSDDGVAHWAHLGGFIGGAVLAVLLLLTRLVNGRGADLISVLLGRFAWALLGRPAQNQRQPA